jgi:hypothetical protein
MYHLYLDEMMRDQIKIEIKDVYGLSFKRNNGLIQNIVGSSHAFYNNKGIMNQIRFTEKVNDIYQNGNVGTIQYLEQGKVKYKLFNINGLTVNTSYEVNNLKYISSKNGMIFMAEDDQLVILRNQDFAEVAKFQCSIMEEESQIYNTESGIVVCNDYGVFLLNTK